MIRNENDRLTELVFLLDRSGSMAGLTADTIGGFNALIEKQKREPGQCLVTTVLFDHEALTLHDRLPLPEIPRMTEKDYSARGSTALCDALGDALRHVSDIHRYIRPEDVPDRTLFVVTTDGMENASHRYSATDIRRLVAAAGERGWEFLFLGANIDAVETAGQYGIRPERAANIRADSRGTRLQFEAVANAVTCLRADSEICDDWAEDLREDFAKRS